jgi:hypothetical protein
MKASEDMKKDLFEGFELVDEQQSHLQTKLSIV